MKWRQTFSNAVRQFLRGLDDQIIFPKRKLFRALTIDLHGIFNGKCDDGFIPKVQCQPEAVEPGPEVGRCGGNSDGDVHNYSSHCAECRVKVEARSRSACYLLLCASIA